MEEKIQEFYYDSVKEHYRIHAVRWLPDKLAPRGIVQISHGIAEYVRRYDGFARFLALKGFLVVGNDHLGHGGSYSGDRDKGFFAEKGGWSMVVRDMNTLRERTMREYPDVPYFLFGHSMGSFLARTYLIQYPGTLTGCVLSGTGQQSAAACDLGLAVSAGEKLRLGPYGRSKLVDKMCFGTYNSHISDHRSPYDWLSRDTKLVDRYVQDPDCGFLPTISLVMDMLGGIRTIGQAKNLAGMQKDLPILLLSGAEDPVGNYGKGVRRVYQLLLRAGCSDVELRLYPGGRHEMLNELNRADVWQDVLDFLLEKLPKQYDSSIKTE